MTINANQARGSKHGRAKLTEEIVLAIVSDYYARRNGPGPVDLAEKHGVSHSAVSRVITGRTWSHVTGIDPEEHKRSGGRWGRYLPPSMRA